MVTRDDTGEACFVDVGELLPMADNDTRRWITLRHGPGFRLSDRQRAVLDIIGDRDVVETNTDTGETRTHPAGWQSARAVELDATGPTGKRIGWKTVAKRLANGETVKLAWGWTIRLAS